MQRSTTSALRTLVVLASLILIPLIAVFGSSSLDVMEKFFGRGDVEETIASNNSPSEAPVYQPSGEQPPLTAGSEATGVAVVPAHGGEALPPAIPAGYDAPTTAPMAAGVSPRLAGPVNSPDGQPLLTSPPPNAASVVGNGSVSGTPSGIAPAPGFPSETVPSPTSVSPLPPVAGGPIPSAPTAMTQPSGSPPAMGIQSPSEDGTFVRTQERLRDLGAVYYRLESWGSQQQLFRFQCEMAIKSSPGLTRHFEAVDHDPLLAMKRVLAEAEAWYASR